MLRPAAMQSYILSERVVNIASDNISALPAKKFNDTSIQEVDNKFYLVFDWAEGKSLKANEINTFHCEKMGSILADIHLTDFSELGITNNCSDNMKLIDWNYYLHKGKENNAVWLNQLHESIDSLYEWNAKANESARLISSIVIISHRDIDSKNVIWHEDNPLIIDWESAGFVNPMQELTETAIYWSEDEAGNIDKERFLAFIHGYKNRYGRLRANWGMVLSKGFLGKLEWLEYNLKRSLRIECTDIAEQQMRTDQVTGTIEGIRRYAGMIPELEKWLYAATE